MSVKFSCQGSHSGSAAAGVRDGGLRAQAHPPQASVRGVMLMVFPCDGGKPGGLSTNVSALGSHTASAAAGVRGGSPAPLPGSSPLGFNGEAGVCLLAQTGGRSVKVFMSGLTHSITGCGSAGRRASSRGTSPSGFSGEARNRHLCLGRDMIPQASPPMAAADWSGNTAAGCKGPPGRPSYHTRLMTDDARSKPLRVCLRA
jgi:hypothetical protein